MIRWWRRRSIVVAALLVAFALAAAACTSSAAETTTTTTAPTTTTTTRPPTTTTTTEPEFQKPVGGEAVVGLDREPATLNRFLPGGDSLSVAAIGQAYLTGVQEIDGVTLKIIPEVVTQLPTTSNGGVTINDDLTMTVRYQIKDEAVWEDGTPISGDDFAFTLETILDPDLPIDKTTYENIVSATAGPKTFEYTLSAATVLYELLFDVIIPKHDVEGSDFMTDWNDRTWVSGGPFTFHEWAKGESVTLVRNEQYWKTDPETNQQLPYLDSVTFRFIPEQDALLNAFRAREVDVIDPVGSADVIRGLQLLEASGATVEIVSGPLWEHLNFQFGPGRLDRNPLSCMDDYDMRVAVAQAIDKQKLVDEIHSGWVEPMESYVTAYTPTVSQDAWSQYPYDPAAAAEHYAAAVERSGIECEVIFTTTANNPIRVTLSELLVPMFEEAGIPYSNQLEDSQLFFGETIAVGRWDLGMWSWVGSPGMEGLVSIHDVFDPQAPPPDGSNYYRWGSEDSSVIDDATLRFSDVRDEMNATVDPDELLALFHEAENILADNLVFIPLFARPAVAAVWSDELLGFKHNPSKATHTWNIEDWYRADAEG